MIVSNHMHTIGIDLGGTKIEAGLVHSSGVIKDHIRLATNAAGGPAAVEKQLLEAIDALRNKENLPIAGIGIGVAGQIDAQSGTVYFAPNLPGWRNVPLQENLQRILGIPVKIINDVRAITWGEWVYGAGKGCKDLICVFIGTGIGGGIISGGKLLTGSSNTCGEIGHMTIDFHGPLCTCGNKGCWEAFAGGWAIAKYAKELIQTHGPEGVRLLELADNQLDAVTAKTVLQAYKEGDVLATSIVERIKQALIAGCINLINALNPSRMIIGGGIVDGWPEIISFINAGVREKALKVATRDLQIVPAKLGKEVGVIGSAAMVLDFLNSQKTKTNSD
ncbi:ROK family protein [Candidatus Protochlamydia phocaeensis]|uniref:ROK family protein n=1 Tax=Candidatus Protochlamydia phocaeensis TaxID=1414722 RepID=UPI001E3936BE|nr:ROK family protein [Candidatus Protochlamydia phocaeensis]